MLFFHSVNYWIHFFQSSHFFYWIGSLWQKIFMEQKYNPWEQSFLYSKPFLFLKALTISDFPLATWNHFVFRELFGNRHVSALSSSKINRTHFVWPQSPQTWVTIITEVCINLISLSHSLWVVGVILNSVSSFRCFGV